MPEVAKIEGRPTQAIVDLQVIDQNVRYWQSILTPGTMLMAVVKADGYGHGSVPVAQTAVKAGAQWLGVALAEEGLALRAAGIIQPILVLGQSVGRQIDWAIAHQLALTIFEEAKLEEVAAAAQRQGTKARVHVKVDTGMGRVGLQPEQLNDQWLDRLQNSWIEFEGLFTHFATSDDPDPSYLQYQLQRFLDVVEFFRSHDARPPIVHAANSAAALRFPGTHFDMVRIGAGIYSVEPTAQNHPQLQPSLRLQSQIVFLKKVPAGFGVGYGHTYDTLEPCYLATVPIGYADGYPRILSNRGAVLIRGKRYPVVGRVSMDQIVVQIPLTDPVQTGDSVTLIGRDGNEEILVTELADKAGTIGDEIVTGIAPRVPKSYLPVR
ncbi:MAG: alanine racemase, partial [Firmicutes bacterium]|nr:alanine racemase [Bacillota bacterium]